MSDKESKVFFNKCKCNYFARRRKKMVKLFDLFNVFVFTQLKTNVLTQTLASLDLTTDLLASSIPIDNIQVASSNQNAVTYRGRIPDAITFNIPSGCNSGTTVENGEKLERGCISEISKDLKEGQTVEKVKTEIKVEDEEEIDVERVDEVDPMWRPW